MANKDSLGDRMKRYENVTRSNVYPRTPTIIRVDGKAFHTFTKEFEFPFSDDLHIMMSKTALAMYNHIQNVQVAYFQSDEISILLKDWATHETQQWFGGGVQKMASIAAATATAAFGLNYSIYQDKIADRFEDLPLFDARVFQIPKEDVNNYFIWRQQDATRNSVQMLAQSEYSHKQLHKKNNSQLQDMLMLEKGINWNDLETWKKRGACVKHGRVDREIPIFTADREYIEDLLE